MDGKVAEFRRVAERLRREGTSARYPEDMRRFALTHAQRRIGAGASVQAAARELGLGGQTLTNWLRARVRKKRAPMLVPVEVRAEVEVAHRATVVIILGELRIEVADVSVAVELVRVLR